MVTTMIPVMESSGMTATTAVECNGMMIITVAQRGGDYNLDDDFNCHDFGRP